MLALKKCTNGLIAAINAAGSLRALGDKLGITYQAIQQWDKIPADRMLEIERAIDVPRHILRPDLYEGYERRQD